MQAREYEMQRVNSQANVMFKSEHTASIYRFAQNLRFSQRATFIHIDSGLRDQCLVVH